MNNKEFIFTFDDVAIFLPIKQILLFARGSFLTRRTNDKHTQKKKYDEQANFASLEDQFFNVRRPRAQISQCAFHVLPDFSGVETELFY